MLNRSIKERNWSLTEVIGKNGCLYSSQLIVPDFHVLKRENLTLFIYSYHKSYTLPNVGHAILTEPNTRTDLLVKRRN